MASSDTTAASDPAPGSNVLIDADETSPARRRGRPQHLPADLTPFTATKYGGWPRVAWLLAINRLYHPDAAIRGRKTFVTALTDHGLVADLSRVSRWESGTQPVPGKVISCYERVLGAPPGSLLAAARTVVRSSDAAGNRRELTTEAGASRDEAYDLEVLLEAATGPRASMNGGDWLNLASGLGGFAHVFLPRTSWRVLCSRLIRELARTAGADELRRYEASVMLVHHAQAQPHMVRALGEWLLHPDVQVAAPMLSLLQELDTDAASQLVLRLLDVEVRPVRDGALSVAAAKLARGHFDAGVAASLERHGRRAVLGAPNPALLVNALDLAAYLPEPAFRSIAGEARDPHLRARLELARTHAELLAPEQSRPLARSIATRVQDELQRRGADSDPMLEHLVRELLSHVHEPRRSAAGKLLAASPYRHALTGALVDLTGDDNELVASRAWDALLTIGFAGHDAAATSRATEERRPGARFAAVAALRGCRTRFEEAHARAIAALARTADAPDLRSHALAALGLRAPDTLEGLVEASPEITRAVYWWQGVGHALADDDTAVAV